MCVVLYCFVTMVVCIVELVFMSCYVMVSVSVLMFVVYLVLLNVVCFLSLGVGCILLVCVVGVMDDVIFV